MITASEPFPVYRSSHMPDLVQAVKLEKENKSQNVEEEGSSGNDSNYKLVEFFMMVVNSVMAKCYVLFTLQQRNRKWIVDANQNRNDIAHQTVANGIAFLKFFSYKVI